MEVITSFIVVFWFIYIIGDKYTEEFRSLLSKVIDLLPSADNLDRRVFAFTITAIFAFILLLAFFIRP
ncbi:hypothetical protein ACFL6S_23105 [Candidatus Poribacteria bacterium]